MAQSYKYVVVSNKNKEFCYLAKQFGKTAEQIASQ
jgi:hypothetical protein